MEMGELSPYTCPECHGVLVQIREGNRLRFRCHTGHAYSLNVLLAEVTKSIEAALWNAARVLDEGEMLLSHVQGHLHHSAAEMAETAVADEAASQMKAAVEQRLHEVKQQGELVREAVFRNQTLSEDTLRDAQ
jgi:two-component system chemotaxis response regulator CheB